MQEGLLKSEIKLSLENIIKQCFYINRMLDRMSSVLDIKLVMPNTGKIIHHNYAHLYPRIADLVSNYMIDRNSTVVYGETPVGNQEYNNISECFNFMLEIHLELEKIIKEAMIKSSEDFTTKVFLEKFLRYMIPITGDILLLIDKADMYGDSNNNNMRFDKDILVFPFKVNDGYLKDNDGDDINVY